MRLLSNTFESMGPLERYRQDLEQGLIASDEEQMRVAASLDALQKTLISRVERQTGLLRGLANLFSGQNEVAVKGLYVWGGVGRGKTYLMDLFYECVPGSKKRRTHFHRFMQEIHQELTHLQGTSDPIKQVAEKLANEVEVLCFDEFFVSDIGDAMILGGLLEALFAKGVVLVATSNVEPEHLYENGLQRERFLPAIALIERHTEIVEIKPGTDYRLERLSNAELYIHPLSDEAETKLRSSFRNLAPDIREIEENPEIRILNRDIPAIASADDVVWFNFAALCDSPRSAFDYVEIARLYHALILSDVPSMGDAERDQARRFINLIDELYDRRVKIIISAATNVEQLYTGSQLAFEFERTRSRLLEMQSHDYLCEEHRAS